MRSQGVNKATLFRLAGLQEPKETNQEHRKLSDSTTELLETRSQTRRYSATDTFSRPEGDCSYFLISVNLPHFFQLIHGQ